MATTIKISEGTKKELNVSRKQFKEGKRKTLESLEKELGL